MGSGTPSNPRRRSHRRRSMRRRHTRRGLHSPGGGTSARCSPHRPTHRRTCRHVRGYHTQGSGRDRCTHSGRRAQSSSARRSLRSKHRRRRPGTCHGPSSPSRTAAPRTRHPANRPSIGRLHLCRCHAHCNRARVSMLAHRTLLRPIRARTRSGSRPTCLTGCPTYHCGMRRTTRAHCSLRGTRAPYSQPLHIPGRIRTMPARRRGGRGHDRCSRGGRPGRRSPRRSKPVHIDTPPSRWQSTDARGCVPKWRRPRTLHGHGTCSERYKRDPGRTLTSARTDKPVAAHRKQSTG